MPTRFFKVFAIEVKSKMIDFEPVFGAQRLRCIGFGRENGDARLARYHKNRERFPFFKSVAF